MENVKILIADDSPEFANSVKCFFEGEEGYQVVAMPVTV